ncbi:hypothetical protein L7F22_006488 [Adiantum nelumboides]|nr:hypothetical protein [Adiantum nelumboides]
MAQDNQGNKINIESLNLAHDVITDEGRSIVNYLVGKIQEGMGNPTLQVEVQDQIHQLQNPPNAQQERAPDRPLYETSKKGTSLANEEEMHDEPPQQSTKDGVVHQEQRNVSDALITSKSNAAPMRRRAKQSLSPAKKKPLSSAPSHANSKKGKTTQEGGSGGSNHHPLLLLPLHPHHLPMIRVGTLHQRKLRGEASGEAMRHEEVAISGDARRLTNLTQTLGPGLELTKVY